MFARLAVTALALAASSCATARLVGPRPEAPVAAVPTSMKVIVEPFFELKSWQEKRLGEYEKVRGEDITSVGPTPEQLTPGKTKKTPVPYFAKPARLADEQKALLAELRRLRPNWTIVSTGAAGGLEGDAVVVRTIVGNNVLIESDRTIKNLALVFGFILLPLEIIAGFPVQETQRLYGFIEVASSKAQMLAPRRVKYAGQPDFNFTFNGLVPTRRSFGFDLAYEEGLLADEAPRGPLLVEDFIAKLAVAIVAHVEDSVLPPPPPMPTP